MPRETPLSLIHLRNLTTLAEAGARVVPAIPAWYHNPQTIEDATEIDYFITNVKPSEVTPKWVVNTYSL